MAKPIKPSDIEKSSFLPDFVIEGINNAIKEKYRGKAFTIFQKEIVSAILKVAPKGTTDESLYDNHYLDFEIEYEKYGWKVIYDRPAYNESYEASFRFIPMKYKKVN